MKMKKKGYAMGGMKKGYAMGGMKKKMKAGGGVKKMEAGGPTGMITQEQIDDPARAVAAGNREAKLRAQEGVPGKKKLMRPKKRPTAPMTSMRPKTRPASMSAKPDMPMGGAPKPMGGMPPPQQPPMGGTPKMPMMKKGGMTKKMKAGGGVAKKGKAKGGKSKVRGAGIAQRGVRPAKMR